MSAEETILYSMIAGGPYCPQMPPKLAARWIGTAALAVQIPQAHRWDCGCHKRQCAGRQHSFILGREAATRGSAPAYYSGV